MLGGVVAAQGEIDLVADPAHRLGRAPRSATSPASRSARASAGRFLHRHGPRVGMTAPRVDRVEGFYARHGGKAILVGRFVGIIRAVSPFLAGASGLRLRAFLPWSLLGTRVVGERLHARRLRVPRVLQQAAGALTHGAFALACSRRWCCGARAPGRHVRLPHTN